ncbi:MAG: hypothetical protein ACRERC_17375 [Candidatus Binatia bacterium]
MRNAGRMVFHASTFQLLSFQPKEDVMGLLDELAQQTLSGSGGGSTGGRGF